MGRPTTYRPTHFVCLTNLILRMSAVVCLAMFSIIHIQVASDSERGSAHEPDHDWIYMGVDLYGC